MLLGFPLIDWPGPQFLAFYAVAFVAAVLWTRHTQRRAWKHFGVPGAEPPAITDPYEVAYLAGGAPRCALLAELSLLESGAILLRKRRGFGNGKLIAGDRTPVLHDPRERALYLAVVAAGASGLAVHKAVGAIAPHLGPIESRLAKAGLRPTATETAGIGIRSVMPLLMLFLLGLVKLFVGWSRGKPVMFLVIALFLTGMAMVLLSQHRRKLTPAGEAVLAAMRDKHGRDTQIATDLATMPLALALFGVAGLSGYGHLLAMDTVDSLKWLSTAQIHGGGTSGSGCSSGCGTSCGGGGCGGGGCGGCGGGD